MSIYASTSIFYITNLGVRSHIPSFKVSECCKTNLRLNKPCLGQVSRAVNHAHMKDKITNYQSSLVNPENSFNRKIYACSAGSKTAESAKKI
jgi:peroxiredoxin family protein